MKKIILTLVAIVSLSFSYAQTATSTTTTTNTPPSFEKPTTTTTSETSDEVNLDAAKKNIDRLLVYFNRYRQAGDIENISKLISKTDEKFYTNFTQYLKTAPVFTIKRDVERNIVKTGKKQYIIQALMTVDKKERRVSVSFIEEKTETSVKWLIVNTNMHTLGSPQSNNLGSNALSDPAEPTKTAPKLPIKNTPETETSTLAETAGGPDLLVIAVIGGLLLIIIGGIVAYIFCKKKIKAKIIGAGALAANATNTISEAISTPMNQLNQPETPPSNVTISTVETVHPVIVPTTDITNEGTKTSEEGTQNMEAEVVGVGVSEKNSVEKTEQKDLIAPHEAENTPKTENSKNSPDVEEKIMTIVSQPEEVLGINQEIPQTPSGEIQPVSDVLIKSEDSETSLMPQTTETIELQKNENEVVAAPHPLFENIFNTDASQEINTENAPIGAQ